MSWRNPEPTWCVTHNWATTGWPGTWGQRCALSQGDCVTEVRAGVKKRWSYERQAWIDPAMEGQA